MIEQTELAARVSLSELFHRSAELFDKIEIDGVTLVVTRNGRAVAMLTPVGASISRRRFGEDAPTAEEPIPTLELGETALTILFAAAEIAPTPWMSDELGLHNARFELESNRLLKKGWSGYEVTPLGLRYARQLRN